MTATDLRRTGTRDDGPDDGPDDGGLLPASGRRRRRVVLLVAATIAFAVLVTWVVAFSSVFGARTVEVHGTRTLPAGTVERAADVPKGTPLVRLDTAAITERVEALPQVATAQVSTSFPSTVVITVEERVAVAYVTVAGRPLLVDRTGLRYLGVDSVPKNLPRLVVAAGAGRATTAAVATVAAALPAALRARVRSVQALDPGTVTLVLRSDVLVRWGSASDSVAKGRVAEALLERSRPRPDLVDVSNPELPFTR